MIERSGKRDIFRDEDAIERKTFPNAVKRGQAVRGFLNCLTDAPIGHLEASIGLGLEVRYKDVLGIQHEMSMLGKRNADSFVYQPGMRPLRR